MPKARIDEAVALHAVRTVMDDFTSTPQQIATQLSIRSFDWRAAAYIARVDRAKLYHWFSDTFKRQFYQPISPADMKTLKEFVYTQLNLGIQVLTQDVESKLSQQYERRQVTIAVANCKASYRKYKAQGEQTNKQLLFDESASTEFNPFVFSICFE